MLHIRIGRRVGVGVAGLALSVGLVAASVAPAALGKASAGPSAAKIKADQKKAKSTFATTCGTCHVLKAAGTTFGTLGPNLDKTNLTQATIIKAITKGGSSVMTKAAIAKFTTTMTPYGSSYSATDINNLAAFIYESTHKGAHGVYK